MGTFYIKQNDTGPAIQAQLLREDESGTIQIGNKFYSAVDVTGAAIEFHMAPADGGAVKVSAAGSIVVAASGQVQYAWAAGDTDTVGKYVCEWQVTFASGVIETFPNIRHDNVVVSAEID